ncbi:iron complex transport system substrate-binding protein [Sporobacter termitidis DSM 10068]|uniref:Iron complex transport system substrate-binding protein n=1 Tax=Sporobacter termitidis DSM 10068 TaxID=1123282 RepID=A0A1M5XC07_9FIRM|nr:ABC transporter substrate-binding protein [Sporobacter termitidis]SHH97351.1 iron complex transport system substrate-binding protein [Sporobacter termitidis DSM 10068]
MKKVVSVLLALMMALSIAACASTAGTEPTPPSGQSASPSGNASPSQTPDSTGPRTITDMAGKEVTIPATVNKIADAWFAHNEIAVMLGADSKIVATAMNEKTYPWLYLVGPGLSNALSTFGTDFNLEELVQKSPDIVFCSTSDKNIEKLQSMGIPVVQLMFTSFDEMRKCVTLTGDILGGDAVAKAAAYNDYLSGKLESIKAVTDKIAAADRPKVLHVTSLSPLQVDGSDTIIDDWINVAGGVNAAASVKSNMQQVTMEQVIAWNPDVIIVGGNAGNSETLAKDPNWASIAAVQKGQVYQNPAGAFLWDRYGAEEALQIQWAAKTINPDLFKDLDIASEAKSFYKTFLNYDLTDDQVQKILTAQKP